MKTVIGVTRTKRRIKRAAGISQVQAWTKPSRIKQKVKYSAGLYSPTMRFIRQTSKGKFPSFLGLLNLKK